MSYLKSSLFYLKDINDFLDEKHNQYGNFSKYIDDGLHNDPKEILPFLERIIMNEHHYQLNKEKFIADANSNKSLYTTFFGIIIAIDLVVLLYIIWMLYRGIKGSKSIFSSLNTLEKGMFCIGYIIPIIAINFICILGIKTCRNRVNDFQGRTTKSLPIEDNFIDFDKPEGVAMYYALKRNFIEPMESKNRKAIKARFNNYTEKPKGTSIIKYPTLSDIFEDPSQKNVAPVNKKLTIIQREWLSLIDSCKHILTTKFEEDIKDKGGMVIGQKSKYDVIDKQIIYSSNVSLLKELKAQGEILKDMISNTASTELALKKEDINNIVNYEIVPIFNMGSSINELRNARLGKDKETSETLTLLEPATIVSSNIECMLNCEINDACLVSAYNIPSKKCSLYKNKIKTGDVLSLSNEDIIYAKGDQKDIKVFLVGGETMTDHTRQIFDSDGTDLCKTNCLKSDSCVKIAGADPNLSGTACTKLSSSDAPISIDSIKPECGKDSAKECFWYKQDMGKISTVQDLNYILEKGKKLISDKLVLVIQKYKYEFNLMDNSDLIKEGLTTKLGFDIYNKISDKINEILDYSQTQADRIRKLMKSTPTPIYIPESLFIENVNKMTYKDLGSLYYSIDTLALVTEDLNNMIQQNIAENLSAENNIFLEKDRQVELNKIIIGHIAFLALIVYIYYVLNYFNVKDRSFIVKHPTKNKFTEDSIYATINNFVPIAFRIVIPLALVLMTIVMMSSWNIKVEGINAYNREVLEKNGGNLVQSIKDLKKLIEELQNVIRYSDKKYSLDTKVSEMNLPVDKEKEIYNQIIVTVDLLTKCNLLTDGSDVALPFPWTDVSFNIITICICLMVLSFVFYELDPVGKFNDIRKYNIMYRKIDAGIPTDIMDLDCNDDTSETSAILKILALIVFIILLITFCNKLMTSSSDYVMGLYNSKYYEQGRCAS
jgi:hypothetical protein